MRIIGWEPKEEEQKPSKVERWYDRHTRSWVIQLMDLEGNQIGDAVYVARKAQAIAQEKEWKGQYNI